MTGVADIRTAIGAILETVPGVVGEVGNFANPDAPITSSDIPGYFVHHATQGAHEKNAAGEVKTLRVFFAVLIVAQIPDNDPVGKAAAYAALFPYIDAVPLAFATYWNGLIGADERPLPEVAGISRLQDDVPEEIQREGKRYAAIPWRITIAMYRSL